MTELRKPASNTPEAFTKLARACLLELSPHEQSSPVSSKIIRTSQVFIREVRDGVFAKKKRETHRQQVGAAQSLARFCNYFKLDKESCFEACGIPKDLLRDTRIASGTAALGEGNFNSLIVTEADWQKVHAVMQIIGSMQLKQIVDIILTHRANQKGE